MDPKERILEKATELFMQYGIRSITMDEISSRLGMSKKTLYLYFDDKDAIVEGVVRNQIKQNECKFEEFHARSENAVHENYIGMDHTTEMLQVVNPQIFYDLEKFYPEAHRKLIDHLYRSFLRAVVENLKRGIQEELFREDLDLDIVARYRLESSFLCFRHEVFPPRLYKMSDVSRELALLFLHSICTPKGKKLMEKYSTKTIKLSSHEKHS